MSAVTPDEWTKLIFRSRVSDRCKVVLLFLAGRLRSTGLVSVPRATIARGVNKSERRVTECIKEAKDAGLLDTSVRGQKGVTAVYQALRSDVQEADVPPAEQDPESVFSGSCTSPLNDAETRPLNGLTERSGGGMPAHHYYSGPPSRVPDEGKSSSYEEQESFGVLARVTREQEATG